jgi:hypothetical protein
MSFASTYQTDCCAIRGGIFHIGKYRTPQFVGTGQTARPVYPQENRDVGEVSKATINQSVDTKSRQTHRTPFGGEACSTTIIKSATLELTVDCTSATNTALAMAGLLKEVPAGVVAAEPVIVVRNLLGAGRTLIELANLIDDTQPVTVTGVGGTPAYVAGMDYVMEAGNLYWLDTTALPVLTSFTTPNVEVSYNRRKQLQIESNLDSGQIYTLSFAQFARGAGSIVGNQIGVRYAKLEPTKVDLITEDYDQFDFKFNLLPDPALAMSTAFSPYYWGFFGAR